MSALPLLAAALLAQAAVPPSAGAGGAVPDALVLPGLRVHLVASEDLDPDSLGAFARPGVVLWLRTRSNSLRPSTLKQLRRFSEAWVELRPPLLPTQLGPLATSPRAGVWLRSLDAAPPGFERLGIRRLAVDVAAPLDGPRFARLRALAPARVRWSPPSGEVPLDAFARFAQLPAQRTLMLPAALPLPRCEGRAEAGGGGRAVIAAGGSPALLPALRACGLRARVTVEPSISDEALRALFAAAPEAELEVQVGADDRRALAARRLLERLERLGTGAEAPAVENR